MTDYAKNQPVRGNVTSGMDRILDKPRVDVRRDTAQNTTSGAAGAMVWEVEVYDTDGMWDATLPDRIIARTAGLYAFEAWMSWTQNVGGFRHLYFNKTDATGAVTYLAQRTQDMATVVGTYMGTSAHIPLNAGEYVQVIIGQTSGGALTTIAGGAYARENGFQACLIST